MINIPFSGNETPKKETIIFVLQQFVLSVY